jgi:hypothetical protein
MVSFNMNDMNDEEDNQKTKEDDDFNLEEVLTPVDIKINNLMPGDDYKTNSNNEKIIKFTNIRVENNLS